MTKTFLKLPLTVKIDLVEVNYYLKFKQVFHLLSKPYDKRVTQVGPLLCLNMLDIRSLHLLH